MKDNAGFILIFSYMMVSILYLSGCTLLDTSESKAVSWRVTLQSNEDGDCRAEITTERMDDVSDDSITVRGGGT